MAFFPGLVFVIEWLVICTVLLQVWSGQRIFGGAGYHWLRWHRDWSEQGGVLGILGQWLKVLYLRALVFPLGPSRTRWLQGRMQNGALQTFEAWKVPEVTPCYTMARTCLHNYIYKYKPYVFFCSSGHGSRQGSTCQVVASIRDVALSAPQHGLAGGCEMWWNVVFCILPWHFQGLTCLDGWG